MPALKCPRRKSGNFFDNLHLVAMRLTAKYVHRWQSIHRDINEVDHVSSHLPRSTRSLLNGQLSYPFGGAFSNAAKKVKVQ